MFILLQQIPIPLPTFPLKGEEATDSLPFRGRERVGVGQTDVYSIADRLITLISLNKIVLPIPLPVGERDR